MQADRNALPIGHELVSPERTYIIEKTLKAGGFGIMYKASATIMVENIPTPMHVAIKEHFLSDVCERDPNSGAVCYSNPSKRSVEESRQDFITEARRLNKLSGRNKNIVRVNEVFEANNTAYYVMEFLDGGDLRSFVKERGPLSESQALSYILPIASAVQFLHDDRLLHLDIKPDNIVLNSNLKTGVFYPVLIDFGVAKHFDKKGKPTTKTEAKGVSEGYAPIEQYSTISSFSPELDVYALGATLLFLLTRKDPEKAFEFHPESIKQLEGTVSERTLTALAGAMQKLKEHRTKTVQDFIAALAKPHTLIPGFYLRSPHTCYVIKEISGETDSFIEYRAIVTRSSITDTGDEISPTNNGTLFLHPCTVLECFQKNSDERKENGSVVRKTLLVPGFQAEVAARRKKYAGNNREDFIQGNDGSVTIDQFRTNGTDYLVTGKKQRLIIDWKSLWNKYSRIVYALVGIIASVFLYVFVKDHIKKPDVPDPTVVDNQHIIAEKEYTSLIADAEQASREGHFRVAATNYQEAMKLKDDDYVRAQFNENAGKCGWVSDVQSVTFRFQTENTNSTIEFSNTGAGFTKRGVSLVLGAASKDLGYLFSAAISFNKYDKGSASLSLHIKSVTEGAEISLIDESGKNVLSQTKSNGIFVCHATASKAGDYTVLFELYTGEELIGEFPLTVTFTSVEKSSAQQNTSSSNMTPPARQKTDDELFSIAMETGDWKVMQGLADRNYTKAYIPLARHYLENATTHEKADYYAKKALASSPHEANQIILALRDSLYY